MRPYFSPLWHPSYYQTLTLLRYGGSLHTLLSSVYPEHKFDPWKFRQVSVSAGAAISSSPDGWRRFCDEIAGYLQLERLEDWYRVSRPQLRSDRRIKTSLIKKAGGLYNLLTMAYPEHPWDASQLGRSSHSTGAYRRALTSQIKLALVGEPIQEQEVLAIPGGTSICLDLCGTHCGRRSSPILTLTVVLFVGFSRRRRWDSSLLPLRGDLNLEGRSRQKSAWPQLFSPRGRLELRFMLLKREHYSLCPN